MKIFTRIICIALLPILFSCNNRVVPLKNKYDNLYEFSTTFSKEQTWDKLLTMVTKQGLVIKALDKADGIITTDNTSFMNTYTWEDNDGRPVNPDAYVVCSKFRGTFTARSSVLPTTLNGQWIFRILPGDKATVIVRLANINGKIESTEQVVNTNQVLTSSTALQVMSTGIFEKKIEKELRN